MGWMTPTLKVIIQTFRRPTVNLAKTLFTPTLYTSPKIWLLCALFGFVGGSMKAGKILTVYCSISDFKQYL